MGIEFLILNFFFISNFKSKLSKYTFNIKKSYQAKRNNITKYTNEKKKLMALKKKEWMKFISKLELLKKIKEDPDNELDYYLDRFDKVSVVRTLTPEEIKMREIQKELHKKNLVPNPPPPDRTPKNIDLTKYKEYREMRKQFKKLVTFSLIVVSAMLMVRMLNG